MRAEAEKLSAEHLFQLEQEEGASMSRKLIGSQRRMTAFLID